MELNHRGTVILETKRLILRPFTVEDAEAMFRNWANDPQVAHYLSWQPHADISVTRLVLEEWEKNLSGEEFLPVGNRVESD
jgi:ribosomal-protein-alanine N-acetyltransferase